MNCTPVHPNLLLERPLTRDEMIDALHYEGMFGIGREEDIATAQGLAEDGYAICEEWDRDRGWHVCITVAGRRAAYPRFQASPKEGTDGDR